MYGLEQMQEYSGYTWAISIIGYVLMAIGLFFSAKKANTKTPRAAFIPVVQIVVLLQLIDKTLAVLNILAFLFHTILSRTDKRYQLM